MKNIKKIFLFAVVFIMGVMLVRCSTKDTNVVSEPMSRTNFFMGTVVKISLYDKKDNNIIDKAFDRIRKIENAVSINKEGTDLDKVNEASGKSPVKVKDDTFIITKRGYEYSKVSKGSFDITIGPIVKLWSIGLPEAKVPTKEEIDKKLQLVGYEDLQLNEENKTIFLNREGMIIDLGAIAKGYTADAVAEVLKEEGVRSAIIDLGGNVFALGERVDGNPWRIGIQNPFEGRGQIIGTIEVKDKSIVTSGVYERYIEKEGKKYHHILSPFTGYPYDNEIAGVTIVSSKSVDGDALSTTIFSKGLNEGLEFIEGIEDTEAIFVTKDKNIYITGGLKNILKINNSEFKLMS